jgi:hypothetical protein
MKKYLALSTLALTLTFYSCSGESTQETDKPHHVEAPLKIISPKTDTQYIVGDAVEIEIAVSDPARIKNLQLFFSDTLYSADLKAESQKITINTANGKVGYVKIYFAYQD